MDKELSAEDLEEFRRGIEVATQIAKRMAEIGTDEFKSATEWEFMAGVLTLAAWMSGNVSRPALELAINLATDSARHMGTKSLIGLKHDPLTGT